MLELPPSRLPSKPAAGLALVLEAVAPPKRPAISERSIPSERSTFGEAGFGLAAVAEAAVDKLLRIAGAMLFNTELT